MRYRPDIEGLRAVAILLVVAAHAKIPGFQGGFIGVDIFFVVSGFLITGLLVEQRLDSGGIDFPGFYARRFRRLLPALLVMLGVSALLGWQLLPPSTQQSQAVAGVATSLWLSNVYFAFTKVGYFEPGSETNMYLHTWSLGVEEQFYLVWPALIALILVRAGNTGAIHRRLAFVMSGLTLASLVAGIWLTGHSANHAFYLMPMRAWQFALGALVYLYEQSRKNLADPTPGSGWLATLAGIAGLGLIGCGLLLVGPATPYPGAWALLPTVGTALLIGAGSSGASPVTRTLSLRPMQFVGSVSYSWYLWHWPVLILGSVLVAVDGVGYRLLLVTVSLLLALALYRWVESPLRRDARLVVRPGWTVRGALTAMAFATLGYISWAGYAQQRYQAATVYLQGKYEVRFPAIYGMGCDDWYSSADVKVCEFGSSEAKNTAVVMGDSIGLQWFPALERIFATPDWRLLVLTKSSCPMVDRPFYYARIGREFTECALWRQRSLDFIAKLAPRMVVLGSTHTVDYSREDWVDGTKSVLARISPHVEKIVVLRSTPHLPFDGVQCLEPRGMLYDWLVPVDRSCAAPPDNQVSGRVAKWIAEAAASVPNAWIVDMDDLVCPNGLCHAVLNGKLVYRDRQHLNADFVADLAGPMSDRMGL